MVYSTQIDTRMDVIEREVDPDIVKMDRGYTQQDLLNPSMSSRVRDFIDRRVWLLGER